MTPDQFDKRLTRLEKLLEMHRHKIHDGTKALDAQLIKKNNGGPITASGVDLDSVSISGLHQDDVIMVVVTCSAVSGTSTGEITLVNNTDALSLGNVMFTTVGLAAGNTTQSTTFITPGASDKTVLIVKNSYNGAATGGGSDATSRDRCTVVAGNNGNAATGWKLALHKGSDTNTCSLYWRWCVYKLS